MSAKRNSHNPFLLFKERRVIMPKNQLAPWCFREPDYYSPFEGNVYVESTLDRIPHVHRKPGQVWQILGSVYQPIEQRPKRKKKG